MCCTCWRNVLPSITMWGLGCLIIDRDWNLIFDTTALLCTAKRWDSTVKYFNSNIFFIKRSTRLLWILSVQALAFAMKNEIQSKDKPFLESQSVRQWPTSQPGQMEKRLLKFLNLIKLDYPTRRRRWNTGPETLTSVFLICFKTCVLTVFKASCTVLKAYFSISSDQNPGWCPPRAHLPPIGSEARAEEVWFSVRSNLGKRSDAMNAAPGAIWSPAGPQPASPQAQSHKVGNQHSPARQFDAFRLPVSGNRAECDVCVINSPHSATSEHPPEWMVVVMARCTHRDI